MNTMGSKLIMGTNHGKQRGMEQDRAQIGHFWRETQRKREKEKDRRQTKSHAFILEVLERCQCGTLLG